MSSGFNEVCLGVHAYLQTYLYEKAIPETLKAHETFSGKKAQNDFERE